MRTIGTIFSVFILSSSAHATDYKVTPKSNVSFLARITAGSFVGESKSLSGTVHFDEKTSLLNGKIEIIADSFDTGMSSRDRHMREKYLETERFPKILFIVKDQKASNQSGAENLIEGNVVIKGVEKENKIKIKVDSCSSERCDISSKFNLNILDYSIPQPRFAVVKMDPTIDVTLKLSLEKNN